MHQPPDETVPPEDHPPDEASGQGAFTVQEPPQAADGTRPLKPPQPRSKAEGKPPVQTDRSLPATVLRQAPETPLKPTWEPIEETGRVRLLPQVPDPPPWRLILQMVGAASSLIGLDVRRPLVIGRADPSGEQQPDLDLSPYHAADEGVSRRHALLIPDHDHLYLADMESTNGTWINGIYLQPGRRYPLAPGDQIEFGLLRLIVRSVARLKRSSLG